MLLKKLIVKVDVWFIGVKFIKKPGEYSPGFSFLEE